MTTEHITQLLISDVSPSPSGKISSAPLFLQTYLLKEASFCGFSVKLTRSLPPFFLTQVVEFDEPSKLLANENSRFCAMLAAVENKISVRG